MTTHPSTSDPGQGSLNPPCKQAKLEFGHTGFLCSLEKYGKYGI